MLSHRATDYTPFRNTCAPQKVDPALIARVRPTIVTRERLTDPQRAEFVTRLEPIILGDRSVEFSLT